MSHRLKHRCFSTVRVRRYPCYEDFSLLSRDQLARERRKEAARTANWALPREYVALETKLTKDNK